MEKCEIESLILEVTRECNMHCAHCLRGDIPDDDKMPCMSKETADKVLASVQKIDNLTFTGGEPTLAMPLLKHIVHTIKKNHIDLYSFYLVTNGKSLPDDFLPLMDELYEYCMVNSIGNTEDVNPDDRYRLTKMAQSDFYGAIALSVDRYHEPISIRNILMLQSRSYFREDKIINDNNKEYLLPRGRAEHLSAANAGQLVERSVTNFYTNDAASDNPFIEVLYINIYGDLMADCDLSYEMQKKYTVANIHEPDCFDKIFATSEKM